MGKKSPSPPPPVDYVGGARTQASLDRPDVYTPLGSQTWTQLSPDKYRQDISLTPGAQGALEQDQALQAARAQATMRALGSTGQFGEPLDLSGAGGGREAVQDALYRQHTRYLDPMFEQEEERERNRLANQGFQTGNVGYDRAIQNFLGSKERAYAGARDAAIAGGTAEQQRAQQQALLERQVPFSELLSLIQQGGVGNVQLPQFSAAPQSQLLNALQAQGQQAQGTYAQQVAEQNAQRQLLGQTALTAALLFGTGGAGAAAAGGAGASAGKHV